MESVKEDTEGIKNMKRHLMYADEDMKGIKRYKKESGQSGKLYILGFCFKAFDDESVDQQNCLISCRRYSWRS